MNTPRHIAGAGLVPRRRLLAALLLLGPAAGAARAAALDAISNADASGALRQALEKGATAAISQLGVAGGFSNDPKLRIPLPDGLRQAEKLILLAGKCDELDALEASINRAAELAVPQARQMLTSAIRSMSVQDAKGILTGGEDSVTKFFREKTYTGLTEKFLPEVTKAVGRLGLAQRYNRLAEQGTKFGLVKEDQASVERYVTGKALDGLYAVIAEQEKAIRASPVQAGGKLLQKVFGAMR